MDYLEFKLWKALVLVVLAFAWGIYCGWNGLALNGRPPQRERRGEAGSEVQDSPAGRATERY